VYVLEANPRASRTVPFISKATGVPLAKVATRVMMGEKLSDLRASGIVPEEPIQLNYSAVKEAVLPWSRFPGEDTLLGPEMRATGEVMGIASTTPLAFAKALSGAGHTIPTEGAAFISLADRDKAAGVICARQLVDLGFALFATHGTAGHLARNGIASTHVDKVGDGPYDPIRLIEEGQIDLVINTPAGGKARGDGRIIRRAATRHGIPCVTTAAGGLALVSSIAAIRDKDIDVISLQDHHVSGSV
jgi:carbamoyl-phosphate synthase large subunit